MAQVQRDWAKDATHVLIFLGLIVVLLFLLTWTGVIKCRVVPGWCDVYWSVTKGGQPRILIVTGNNGMGDPDLLKSALADPNYVHVQAQIQNIDLINLGNLKNYDLIIVEKARKISTGKLKVFMDYVNQGGRLVWTGDAGTELAEGDRLLYADEVTEGEKHTAFGPWARRSGDDQVRFDEFLSVQYVTNFCMVKRCTGIPWQGILVTDPGREHPLVYGIRQGLSLRGDFAIVKEVGDAVSTRVLSLDWGSNLIGTSGTDYTKAISDYDANKNYAIENYPTGSTDKDKYAPTRDYGTTFPIIVTSGYGERVAYYAVPPEQFVNPELKDKYFTIIENLYYGMLR